jgi:hypothetical protein
MFDVVGQREVPADIQIIPWEAETGDDIPQAEKSDLSTRPLLLHLIGKMQSQRRPRLNPTMSIVRSPSAKYWRSC